jgi:FlaG/FlaF family flagellin (archaellin)
MKLRRWKRRLGVSTVIANMLMISITLALAAILVAWAGTSFGAFSGGSQVFFQQRGQALQERFVVEYVNFSKGTKGITLFVRNVGVEEINVAAIYVNGTSYTGSDMNPKLPCATSTVLGAVVVTMGVGKVCQFNLTWATTWNSGSIFNIVIATTRGNQATVTSRAP